MYDLNYPDKYICWMVYIPAGYMDDGISCAVDAPTRSKAKAIGLRDLCKRTGCSWDDIWSDVRIAKLFYADRYAAQKEWGIILGKNECHTLQKNYAKT